jgi:hypothetical protein
MMRTTLSFVHRQIMRLPNLAESTFVFIWLGLFFIVVAIGVVNGALERRAMCQIAAHPGTMTQYEIEEHDSNGDA